MPTLDTRSGNGRDIFGDLISIIGEAAMFNFIEEFGGSALYIPQHPPAKGRLVGCVGRDAADAIAARYGKETIKVPAARPWRVQVYRQRGGSLSKIAKAVGASQATVCRILKGLGMTNRPAGPIAGVGISPIRPLRIMVERRPATKMPLFDLSGEVGRPAVPLPMPIDGHPQGMVVPGVQHNG